MSDIRRRKEQGIPHHPLTLELLAHMQDRDDDGAVPLHDDIGYLMDSYFEVLGAFRDDGTIDLNNRNKLQREIAGALRSTIQTHGPITQDFIPSAVKRVIGALKTYNRRRKS